MIVIINNKPMVLDIGIKNNGMPRFTPLETILQEELKCNDICWISMNLNINISLSDVERYKKKYKFSYYYKLSKLYNYFINKKISRDEHQLCSEFIANVYKEKGVNKIFNRDINDYIMIHNYNECKHQVYLKLN